MKILATIKREERKLEKQLGKLQHQLGALRAAAKALGHSTSNELAGAKKRVLTAAVLTSFINTCKRLDIDPFAYLRDIFERISSHPKNQLDELLPDRWMLTRRFAPMGNISAEATHME